MSDLDPIRGLFSGAKAEVSELVKAPGSGAAELAGRRRRHRRHGAAVALAAILITLIIVVPLHLVGPRPVPTGPSPSITPSMTPSATPTPSPVATSSLRQSQEDGVAAASAVSAGPTKPTCVKRGYAWLDYGSGTITFRGIEPGQLYYRICPGETIQVWRATYRWAPDGYARLDSSESGTLTYGRPTVTLSSPGGGPCYALEAYGTGTISFPAAFPPGRQPELRGWANGWGTVAASFNGATAPAQCLATPTP